MKALSIKIGPRVTPDFIGFCVPLPKNAVDLITKIVRKFYPEKPSSGRIICFTVKYLILLGKIKIMRE